MKQNKPQSKDTVAPFMPIAETRGAADTTTTAIANIEQPSDRTAKIYNLNGYLVGEGNPSEVLANKKGIFIVNGKKVVLK